MNVPGGRTIGNHGDGQRRSMGCVGFDLDIEHRGQASKALCADAELIHRLKNLKAERFNGCFWPLFHNFGHIDGGHKGLFRQEHGFFRRAAYADTKDTRRAPAGAHGR